MAEALAHQDIVSAERYLADEERREVRHEFVDGQLHAMHGGTLNHNLITQNLSAYLLQNLSSRCTPFSTDVKLHVKADNLERYYYPDVFVVCGGYDGQDVASDDAVLVAEVLSSSTARTDKVEKFAAYRLLPSLVEYLLISQEEPEIAIHRKRSGWQQEMYASGQTVVLESVDLSLAVDDLHQRVSFNSGESKT